jgi:hypothetical protein
MFTEKDCESEKKSVIEFLSTKLGYTDAAFHFDEPEEKAKMLSLIAKNIESKVLFDNFVAAGDALLKASNEPHEGDRTVMLQDLRKKYQKTKQAIIAFTQKRG